MGNGFSVEDQQRLITWQVRHEFLNMASRLEVEGGWEQSVATLRRLAAEMDTPPIFLDDEVQAVIDDMVRVHSMNGPQMLDAVMDWRARLSAYAKHRSLTTPHNDR